MQTVYIETSVISFLRSRPSTYLVSAARQLMTRQWWDEERRNYQLVTSQFVLDEASRGNQELAADRMAALADIPLLEIPDEVATLADELLAASMLPMKARLDALHISLASYHGIEFLLTWNCTHIANARLLPRIRKFFADRRYVLPEVCTPEEMIDDNAQLH